MAHPLLAEDAARVGPPSTTARQYLPDGVTPIGTMRAVAPTVCTVLGCEPPDGAEEPALTDVVETLRVTERLAHIVIDAFGIATWQCHKVVTPTFNTLAAVRQAELQSVLPAITPVNFSTIVSGASPEVHGVRDRTEQLTTDTTFARLAAAGKSTAACGQRLSTVGILLAPHSTRPTIADSNNDDELAELFCRRVDERIDYILVQLLDIDNAGHAGGPWGPESHEAAARADVQLRKMLSSAAKNGYSLVLHADHGQHDVEPEDDVLSPRLRGVHSGRREEDVRVPFIYLRNEEMHSVIEPSES